LLVIALIIGGILVVTALNKSGYVTVNKDGTPYNYKLRSGGVVIDTLVIHYAGGTNRAVSISSDEWDGVVTRIKKTSKIWVDDNWHVEVDWIEENSKNVLIGIELKPGPATTIRY